MMKALLVRVGIDSTVRFGHWNAPVNVATGAFVYLPIPEEKPIRKGYGRKYEEMTGALTAFVDRHCVDFQRRPCLPKTLLAQYMHLDPNFDHLTYGDKRTRANRIRTLGPGDLIVFYAGLRSIDSCHRRLIYALIGLYTIQELVAPADVEPERWGENAHTSRIDPDPSQVIVRARPGCSGRFERCIPFGEWRGGAYRVRQDLLDMWGGISAQDGFIQRSGVPPYFNAPERFIAWLQDRKVTLLRRNNP